jgi:hypothetical protein
MSNNTKDQVTVITSPQGIRAYMMLAQIGAIQLEGKGLRHSSGRSALAHCKRIYNLKGNRESVIAQMRALLPQP